MLDPLTIIQSDALSALREMESESVQCCVTSPPYWGLRSYGTAPLVWDNENGCEHEWGAEIPGDNKGGSGPNGKNDYGETYGRDQARGNRCECGAWRGELGLEPTPELYVSHIVQILREMKRVLRTDGTLWLNLGDSYASSPPGNKSTGLEKWKSSGLHGANISAKYADTLDRSVGQKRNTVVGDLKPKDLVGIPWMVAFALRADGWYLRSDIIWAKPNPMPESVTDRPTRSHEYIFLLAKSQRYFYDHEAIKEPAVADHGSGNGYKRGARLTYDGRGSDKPYVSARDNFRRENSKRGQPQFGQTVGTHRPDRKDTLPSDTRNKRSVWEIATKPFPEAHFATFPTDLVTPCILAGSKAGDVVLDPFAGSFTTCKVAIELGRKAIGIEPKAEYVEMGRRRCQTTIGLPL